MKFDMKTGEPAWLKLGNRAPGLAKPGQMYCPGWGLAGSVNGIDYYADTFSQSRPDRQRPLPRATLR